MSILCDVVLLHTTSIAIEEHLVHLLLKFLLQLLLLICESGPEFLQFFLQLGILLLDLFALGLSGLALLSQPVSLSMDRLLLHLHQFQSLDSLYNNLLCSGKVALHLFQLNVELFTTAHAMGDECPQSLSNLQSLKK